MLARAGGEGKAINAGGTINAGGAVNVGGTVDVDAVVSTMGVDLAYMLERRGAELRRREEQRRGAEGRAGKEMAATDHTGEIGAFEAVCGTTEVAAAEQVALGLGSPDIDIVAIGDRRAKERRVGHWCRVAIGSVLREMGRAAECDDRESESAKARSASVGES